MIFFADLRNWGGRFAAPYLGYLWNCEYSTGTEDVLFCFVFTLVFKKKKNLCVKERENSVGGLTINLTGSIIHILLF